MSMDPNAPQFAPAPTPEPGTSGLAVAGIILAFLVAPIGFILSLVAIGKTGSGRQKGRGLAITGIVVSLLIMAGTGAIVAVVVNEVGDKVSTITDPGCTLGKSAVLDNQAAVANTATAADGLKKTLDGLNNSSAKA
mgnify:FL=1